MATVDGSNEKTPAAQGAMNRRAAGDLYGWKAKSDPWNRNQMPERIRIKDAPSSTRSRSRLFS